ncbi:MAG: nucleotidyltransferase family protein [Rhodobacteraceae bacterium]|nr:nucleotidyltransferase family protein [Paracoccaceae bacterium]
MIPILIPAAGASSRMQGRDKLMEEIDGQPLLRRTVTQACDTGAPVIVTLPPEPHPRWAALAGLNAAKVSVPDAALGISASLRRGLVALPPGSTAVMVLLADLPDLTTADLARSLAAPMQDPDRDAWRGATEDGKAGHPVVLGKRLLQQVQDLTGDEGFAPLLKGLGSRLALIPLPGQAARTDLDTPDAWAQWRARQP